MESAVKEGDNLSSGTGLIGGEQTLGGASGNAGIHRPKHGHIVVVHGVHIQDVLVPRFYERMVQRRPNIVDRRRPGAGRLGIDAPLKGEMLILEECADL